MTTKPFFQISRPIFAFMLSAILLGMMTEAQATPSLMSAYGAPSCTSCHYDGTTSSGRAGLAAWLASKTTTCTAPQVLQNNVCVTPTPTCTAPQVLQNNVCVTPPPTCTAPQVLQNNVCITPTPTCTTPQVLQNNVCVTPAPAETMVRMQTSLGIIDIRLFDSAAPLTVTNFLNYVDSGAYRSSFIQRSVPGSIIQGGGYAWNDISNSVKPITKLSPVVNEFSADHSNLRGTIAMAKLNGNPNSATNEWFFNLTNNSAKLDFQNGGSTVFGQVVEKSMPVVDAIAALPRKNAGKTLPQVPIATSLNGTALKAFLKKPLAKSNLVTISAISSNRSNVNASDSDRVFAYLEGTYPEYYSPANALSPADSGSSTNANGAYYRYYSATKTYVYTLNGLVYYQGPASQNQPLLAGAISDLLATAVAAGY
ncbi:MAG: hypothetical protein EPN17_18140 [Methylobacter sp.]|nr:MAG: hypothetical protein EPN17_18140 [Methylobacter sp.]